MNKYPDNGLARTAGVTALVALLFLGILPALQAATAKEKPLMRHFMGIDGFLSFKPDLFQPICSLVRNYHPVTWDDNGDTAYAPKFPLSREEMLNKAPVDWTMLYGSWKDGKFEVDDCLQMDLAHGRTWKDPVKDAFSYGEAYAKCFGSSGSKVVASVEISGDPKKVNDALYRTVFENMAKGIRAGDPKLRISTNVMIAGEPDKASQNFSRVKGLENLYDVLDINTFAFTEGGAVLRPTYPERADISYLKAVKETVAWRNAHVPGKEIWITGFGYDAFSKPQPPASKWVGASETEQAQWIVRSFLAFSSMDVDRAYLFNYDDDDAPALHGSSGLMRNFQPKASYYAAAHLQKTLGDYRFSKVITQKKNDLYVYEYVNPDKPKEPIWVAWSPTGSQREASEAITVGQGKVVKAERMPLKEGAAESFVPPAFSAGNLTAMNLKVSESPVYLWLQLP